MMMKKLAIASAVAMMSMGSVYAQQTTVTTNVADNAPGLMTTLSNSVGKLFGSADTAAVVGKDATYLPYQTTASTSPLGVVTPADTGKQKYVLDINGTYRPATDAELSPVFPAVSPLFYAYTPAVAAVAEVKNASKLVDITALGGAVNLSAINGGINITGVNVNLSGVTGALTGLSTTVIGAMNSSTLEIAKSLTTVSDKTGSTLNIAGLANQGPGPTITSQSFGPGQLKLATMGSDILGSASGSTQFNLTGLTSSTETLSSNVTDKLQTMNVFNMAVNMAPLVAGVNIAASVNKDAWFLNPDNGSVKLSGLQVATTTIGAMNWSITRMGANLTK